MIAFASGARNFAPDDTNGKADVFVRYLLEGRTVRASVSSQGVQGNDNSESPVISESGRFVAFESRASNLVPGDRNNSNDVFLRDLRNVVTTRISVSTAGREANDGSGQLAFSGDGSTVAFASYASNLVANDTATCRVYEQIENCLDIFARDLKTGRTEKVSVSSSEQSGACQSGYPSISRDGRYVAFWSQCPGLVPDDHNGVADIFLRDRKRGRTYRVSVASDGSEGDDEALIASSISADGRYVAFASWASNHVSGDTLRCRDTSETERNCADVFVHDRSTGNTSLVSISTAGARGNDRSSGPSISADGRYVAFESAAGNLVAGDHNDNCTEDPRPNTCWDIFVRDRSTGTTVRASLATNGREAEYDSHYAAIAAISPHVAFQSVSSNLVADDTNGVRDVFVRDFNSNSTFRASVG